MEVDIHLVVFQQLAQYVQVAYNTRPCQGCETAVVLEVDIHLVVFQQLAQYVQVAYNTRPNASLETKYDLFQYTTSMYKGSKHIIPS